MRKLRKTESFAARMTPECAWILETLAEQKGVVRSAIFEMAVRDYAKKEGVPIPTKQQVKEWAQEQN